MTSPNNNHLTALYLSKAESRAKWSFIGIVFPIIGVIVGIIAKSTLKHAKLQGADEIRDAKRIRKVANIGLTLSIICLLLNLWFFSAVIMATDKVVNDATGNTTTTTSSPTSSKKSTKQYRFADRADKQEKDVELLPGESGTVGGMKLTASNVQYATKLGDYDKADSGKTYVVVTVTLQNTSNETQSYNEYDFRVQTAGGQVLDPSYALSVTDTLSSADLVAGGNVSGKLVFEVPQEDGHQYLIWKPSSVESDRGIIQLK
jgi:hypothetical protein